jgi:hypothetical protein
MHKGKNGYYLGSGLFMYFALQIITVSASRCWLVFHSLTQLLQGACMIVEQFERKMQGRTDGTGFPTFLSIILSFVFIAISS